MRFFYLLSTLLSVLLLTQTHAKFCSNHRFPRLITINPPTLFDPTPFGYSHISLDTRNAIATVAGQVAINREGQIVGTTLAEQLVETEKALKFALEAVDADVEDIFKLNVYILNFNPSTDLEIYQPTGVRLGSPPSTLISTPALAIEGLLVEIEISVAVSPRTVRKIACKQARIDRRCMRILC